jgi:hypothetical protein
MNNKIINIIIFILVIIFFYLFFYYILTTKNQLIQFKITKIPNYSNTNSNSDNNDKLNFKYEFNSCKQMCNKNFCDEYHTQMIKYDLCKECKKENKCYDALQESCVTCNNNETCESMYGCDNNPPKNPIKNYCNKCWK